MKNVGMQSIPTFFILFRLQRSQISSLMKSVSDIEDVGLNPRQALRDRQVPSFERSEDIFDNNLRLKAVISAQRKYIYGGDTADIKKDRSDTVKEW